MICICLYQSVNLESRMKLKWISFVSLNCWEIANRYSHSDDFGIWMALKTYPSFELKLSLRENHSVTFASNTTSCIKLRSPENAFKTYNSHFSTRKPLHFRIRDQFGWLLWPKTNLQKIIFRKNNINTLFTKKLHENQAFP